MLAATAAAEPLEDPPGVWAELCGLRVFPGARFANSVVTVLPMMTAPAARSMATTVASREGVRPAWSEEPLVRQPRLLARVIGVEEGPGLNLRIDLAHSGQAGLDELLRAEDAVPDKARRIRSREQVKVAQIHGTRGAFRRGTEGMGPLTTTDSGPITRTAVPTLDRHFVVPRGRNGSPGPIPSVPRQTAAPLTCRTETPAARGSCPAKCT